MSSPHPVVPPDEVYYPDNDGQPMANNTIQFNWIVTIKQNLEWWYDQVQNPNAFIAGDLFWYPIEGDNKTVLAPDVLVALGRPSGDRKSYQQWREGGIAPQIIFEILSPANTQTEMRQKFKFYERHGVQEYYVYDPETNELQGWERKNNQLVAIESEAMKQWESPLLGIRFAHTNSELQLYHPNGERFLSFKETAERMAQQAQRAEQEKQRAEQEKQRAEQEKRHSEQEKQRAEQEKQRAEQEKQRAEQEKQRAEQEKQRAEREKQRAEQEKQRAEQEKQRAEQEKQRADRAEQDKREAVKRLTQLGLTAEQIASTLQFTISEVQRILSMDSF